MRRRFTSSGVLLAILPLVLIGASGLFAGLWFLGGWLYDIGWWWFGAPVRFFQWIVPFGAIMFLAYWVYAFLRSLITGKGIED